MPHNLAETNGRIAMMYAGETPWHRLGTRLEEPATAAEAIEAAGLDYNVQLTPLQTIHQQPIANKRAVVRADTQQVLGVVGTTYAPVQNRECFNFLDAVVSEGDVRYHTAGALGNGERVWMLAKLPSEIRVLNSDDITEQYLLLTNSHDGSSSLRVFFTPIRVVCANTLAVAHRQGQGQGVSIIHKGNLTHKVRQAQRILGLAERFFANAGEQINQFARHKPRCEQLRNYFEAVLPNPLTGPSTRISNIRREFERLFEEGIGHDMPQIRHSTWTALNAVTEYVDHYRSTRGKSPQQRAENRLESAWFGSGARLKQRAWDLAIQMAV